MFLGFEGVTRVGRARARALTSQTALAAKTMKCRDVRACGSQHCKFMCVVECDIKRCHFFAVRTFQKTTGIITTFVHHNLPTPCLHATPSHNIATAILCCRSDVAGRACVVRWQPLSNARCNCDASTRMRQRECTSCSNFLTPNPNS